MSYRGKYRVKNPSKYIGDHSNVVYRSLWERNVFRWLESNPDIIKWNSEDVIIPYVCATDKKRHRYFMDIYFEHKNGKKYLIEVKPKKQTKPPSTPKRRTKKFISESLTYAKNMSKWQAAKEFAYENGCEFQIWTEDTLKALGIKTLTK